MIKAYAAKKPGGSLEAFEYDVAALGPDEVEIQVSSCGICYSDISMLDNEWDMTTYPFVGGHEIVGTIRAVGSHVSHLKVGQTVGLGWYASSCTVCGECLSGNHNLCASSVGVIVGRHGGFADRVRADQLWVIPLSDGMDPKSSGPLFCGGITVFNPLVQNQVRPTDRVGVVGIGGLGHMALQFCRAWGCEVTAFSHTPDKEKEARQMGAHVFVDSTDSAALDQMAGSFDLILVAVKVDLDWDRYIALLKPQGKLHFVGAVGQITTPIFPLIAAEKTITASPLGSPYIMRQMLDFCQRHGIAPVTETFPMSKINDALDHLRSGQARYRIVLENDF